MYKRHKNRDFRPISRILAYHENDPRYDHSYNGRRIKTRKYSSYKIRFNVLNYVFVLVIFNFYW